MNLYSCYNGGLELKDFHFFHFLSRGERHNQMSFSRYVHQFCGSLWIQRVVSSRLNADKFFLYPSMLRVYIYNMPKCILWTVRFTYLQFCEVSLLSRRFTCYFLNLNWLWTYTVSFTKRRCYWETLLKVFGNIYSLLWAVLLTVWQLFTRLAMIFSST